MLVPSFAIKLLQLAILRARGRLCVCPTGAATRGGTVLKARLLVIHSLVFKVKIGGSRLSAGNTSRSHSHTINRRVGSGPRRRIHFINARITWFWYLWTTKPRSTLASTMAFFYPYYEILTIIAMILLLMATPFHLNMKGTSTWPFMLWSFIWCLLRTVNGMVWHDRMDNIAPIWCDICGSLWSPPQTELS